MLRVTLRSIRARKLRSLSALLAVLLGVTMIAGTYVFTDTIDRAFASIFKDATKGADAVVSGRTTSNSNGNDTEPPSVPVSLLTQIRQLPDVASAQGQINDRAAIVGRNGKVIRSGGAPTLASSYIAPPFRAFTITRGRPPNGPGEVAIDDATASAQHFRIGQPITITTQLPAHPYTLVGTVRFGGASLGGATYAVFDLATAQRVFLKPGKVDFVSVAARPGISQSRLAAEIAPLLPATLVVRTASAQVAHDTTDIKDQLKFLTIGLLAFGFIAVFVGAFVIFNTFSITVAQRTRELALLRTFGASRRQILRSVTGEALAIGLLGGVLAIGLGFAAALGISALFRAFGLKLPTTGAVLESRTVIVCMLVATIVTLVASLTPALRATRVPPVAALQEGAVLPRSRFAPFVPGLAAVLVVIGVALVLAGLLGGGSLAGTALGAIVLVFGVALISPRLVPATARGVGWPLERATALVGRLARENAIRNPSRTAATAAALMIGLAIVVFVTIFANGAKVAIRDVIARNFAGDLAVVNQNGFGQIPVAAATSVQLVPGVQTVSVFKRSDSRVPGAGTRSANGIDPQTVLDVYRFDWVTGSNDTLGLLGPGGALVEKRLADKLHMHVGTHFVGIAPSGNRIVLTTMGIYKDQALLGGYTVGLTTFNDIYRQSRAQEILVKLTPDADPTKVETAVNRSLSATFPEAHAQSQQQLKDDQASRLNSVLYLFYALLTMSVLVSLFGIVNTLTLSIHERTRELGMLRAVGMSRRQVRRMVRYESVITAAIGAVLGLVLGLFFAGVVTASLSDQGIEFAIPWSQLALLLVLALVLGVLAAVAPARRAARLDVLRSIAYE
jgi:putative ABC transport system permease protein